MSLYQSRGNFFFPVITPPYKNWEYFSQPKCHTCNSISDRILSSDPENNWISVLSS